MYNYNPTHVIKHQKALITRRKLFTMAKTREKIPEQSNNPFSAVTFRRRRRQSSHVRCQSLNLGGRHQIVAARAGTKD